MSMSWGHLGTTSDARLPGTDSSECLHPVNSEHLRQDARTQQRLSRGYFRRRRYDLYVDIQISNRYTVKDHNDKYMIINIPFPGVGKTSLVHRFIKGTFADSYTPTIEDTYKWVPINFDQDVMQVFPAAGKWSAVTMQCAPCRSLTLLAATSSPLCRGYQYLKVTVKIIWIVILKFSF